jgi:hypothetical protein
MLRPRSAAKIIDHGIAGARVQTDSLIPRPHVASSRFGAHAGAVERREVPQIAGIAILGVCAIAFAARWFRLMPPRSWSPAPMDAGGFDVDGELARLFGDGVRPLHLEQALFDAILAGWVRQQRARLIDNDEVRLRLGDDPIAVPEQLAALLRH